MAKSETWPIMAAKLRMMREILCECTKGGNQEIGGSDYWVVARYGYAVDCGSPPRSLSSSLAEGLGPESGPFPFADFTHLPA